MRRIPGLSLSVIGIMFAFIGLMHLSVHFKDLVSAELESALSFSVSVMDNPMDVYRGWQGFSYMMGISFIAVGLLSFISVFNENTPSPYVFVVLIGLLAAVVYSGINFFGSMQIYGGSLGLLIAIAGLLAAVALRSSRH